MSGNNLSRREFIWQTGKFAAAIAVLEPILGSDIMARNSSVPVSRVLATLDLANPDYMELAKVGGAIKIPNPLDSKKPIIVLRRSETTVAAYSSRCTHRGCEVSLPMGDVVLCPCHKSTFDLDGKVTHGPAKKDLETFSATVDGSVITIKERMGG